MRSFLVPSLLPLAVNVHCNVVSLLAFYKCDLQQQEKYAQNRGSGGLDGRWERGKGGSGSEDQSEKRCGGKGRAASGRAGEPGL